MYWYLKVLHQYVDFRGRARRKEYWMFVLINIMFAALAAILDNFLGTTMQLAGEQLPYGFVYIVYGLFMLMPNLAVAVRRLHDTGKSGWYILLSFIPIIGMILIVFLLMDSQPETNKWGPNPKLQA